jgi:hypothetical protein
VTRLSFSSVRAVKLRSTSCVFLADRCHRMLGVRRLSLGNDGCSVGLLRSRLRFLPRHRFA